MIRKLMIFLIILATFSGCVIGTKQKTTIIYSSMSKPIEYKGLVRVATDDVIKVTVDGKLAEIKAGGFYLVHKADLKKLLDIAKGKK